MSPSLTRAANTKNMLMNWVVIQFQVDLHNSTGVIFHMRAPQYQFKPCSYTQGYRASGKMHTEYDEYVNEGMPDFTL